MNPAPRTTQAETYEKRRLFALIAKEHESTLMRAARRMCGYDHELAADIVQDALVSAYRAYLDGRFDGRHTQAWLLRILTNAYLYAKRQNRTDSGLEEDLILNQPGNWNGATSSPDQDLLEGTFSEPLERALMSLPESQRLCVLLADVEELPYHEVAETLKIPIGTVRSRLARARMQMLLILRDLKAEMPI